ncbi:unnamed protein product [Phytophthora fragariaefolia]|uniref:Unnamed protein product n=1 Tax=Phytophthora fragariaefolia TaxID=1490495 RepID=A0A9W6XIT7_9STRA|nr:unnamed protein product [Phytophthora fragariaefolia]
MHRAIMNMARCMIFACGLPLRFWGEAVQYAAYFLNRAPTNANPGRASPLKVPTGKTPPLDEIVVFDTPCTVYRDPRKKNFTQRAQTAMIVGVGEETKGYRVYLPKDRVVVTSEHVKNIESLNKEQNLQVKGLYLQGDETLKGDDTPESENRTSGDTPMNWVYKAKMDAEGAIERLKARLIACGNEQQFGVVYSVTFSLVIEMTSLKLIFALARKWRVPDKHGDVPNAYVKAIKEADLDIYLRIPHGMVVPMELRRSLGVSSDNELVLELEKVLYGLKQAGLLRNQLLHQKLMGLGFSQSLTNMCVYYRRLQGTVLVVGVYDDDLLVTGTRQEAVDAYVSELKELAIKALGPASEFLGMRVITILRQAMIWIKRSRSKKCCGNTAWHPCTACARP